MDTTVFRCCPVCNQRQSTPLLKKSNLALATCSACGMVYASPVSTRLIDGEFYEGLGTPYYLSPAKLESDYSPVRFEREIRLFRKFCVSGEVLDVGCSTGAFLFQLQRQFPGAYQVLGTDVSGPALDYAASRGIATLKVPFLEEDFGPRKFDAICFWAVLEHLEKPKVFLEKAGEILKPNGHIFILVPNWQSLAIRLLGVKYRYLMEEHLNYFTPATLTQLVQSNKKLRVVKVGASHFNPMVLWQDLRRGEGRVADQERAALLQKTTRWKSNAALAPFKFCYRGMEGLLSKAFLADNLYAVAHRSESEEDPTLPLP